MFFFKFIVPALAVFGMAASVIASPIAQPAGEVITKRADDVLSTVQGVSDGIAPLTSALSTRSLTIGYLG